MAPKKHTPKMKEEGIKDGNHFVTDFFKKARPGRPKKRGNSSHDNGIEVEGHSYKKKKKCGPIPKSSTKKDAPPEQQDNCKKPAARTVATVDAPPIFVSGIV
jgi:hypothetical protein